MHLKHLSEHYAHEISSQIIGFCLEKQVSLIVLPKYKKEYTDYVMIGSGNWSTMHLSSGIRSNLPIKHGKTAFWSLKPMQKDIRNLLCLRCAS